MPRSPVRGGWNNRYIFSKQLFSRGSGIKSFRGVVRVDAGGTRRFMWGLKNTNNNYHYNQMPYAIYFNQGNIQIYEYGGNRGTISGVGWSNGVDYELRIDVMPHAGAIYYFRELGNPTWTRLYLSTLYEDSQFRFGVTVNWGVIHFDDYDAPEEMSTDPQPTASYPRPGTYDVSLTVTDEAGQTDTDTTTVTIELGDPPVADPGGPYALDETNASCNTWTFTADGTGSSDDGANGILSYAWDFGDGGTATGATPSHTYAGPSTYTVSLTVTDHSLQTHTASTTVTTNANDPPTANPGGPYAVDESAAVNGFWNATFNGGASTDDVGICDYAWDFGDGGSGTGVSPTHQYAATGTYTVTLTVRDHAHQSHSASTAIEVTANDAPVANDGGPYVIDEAQANAGQWTASFDGSGSSDDFSIWMYEWDFGDGGSGTGATPTHIYNSTGTYDVTLTVADNGRQTNTDATAIQVLANDPPVADAGPARVTERGLPVLLDGTGSTDDFGIYTYLWDVDLPPFTETFAAGIDTNKWRTSGASAGSGDAVVVGAGSWSNRYIFSQGLFTRSTEVRTFTGKVFVESGGNRHVMWGLKNTSTNFSYTQMPYAIYFTNNAVQIYEKGSYRGQFGAFVDNTSYDVRIDLKPGNGAIYYYRETGAATWTQIRDTTNYTDSTFLFGATIHSGTIHFDDFAGPVPDFANPDHPSLTVAYEAVGTFTPSLTVTDHALQTDTDTTTVTVLEGNDPVADGGGHYTTNEDIPTRFNGRGSTDDFAIKAYTWDFGDGTSLTSRNPFADHRYTSSGTFTASLTVTDFAGHSDTDSFTVTVLNAAPIIVLAEDRTSNEGDTVSINDPVKFTDPGVEDTHTATFDWGDGSPLEAVDPIDITEPVPPEPGLVVGSHVYVDDADYSAHVMVTDDEGDSGFADFAATVDNLAPVVEAGADQTVDEGDTVSLDPATFTDAGVADTHTAEIDWGDGSPVEAGTLTQGAGSGSVDGSHVYADNGVYTVTVTVTDDDAGVGSDTFTVTVNNGNPSVEAGADQSIVEGGSISLDPATFTDPGTADIHTATIDWGDGSPLEAGSLTQGAGSGSVAGSHAYGAEGIFTVTVSVTDDDGGVGTDTFTVNVSDAGGPSVDAGPDVVIDEGQSVSLPPSTFVPAIGTDTHTASINWGDGTIEPGTVDDAADTVSGSHTYPQDGSFSVGVTVTNQDDTSGADSFNVTVNNVAPVVEAGADQAADVGATVSLDPATFTDPGTEDIHTATIDWGDGSPLEPGAVTEASGSGTVAGSHVYTDPGTYTVTVDVADDDTSTADTFTVVVSSTGAPPEVISDLAAVAKSGKIDLVWTPADGAATYNVYRSENPGGPYDQISTGWTCTYCAYADFGLTNGVTYYYVVSGVNGTGESPPSNEASGTPNEVEIQPR